MKDIDAFQNHYPVAARQGGRTYRAAKFFKRQKLATALTGLAVAALALGYVGYDRAQTAAVFADERLSETRDMTVFLLDELPASLRTIPGTLPVQKKVTEVSAKYLDVLAKAAKDDPAIIFDYAMGHAQLGEILTVAGGANIGDPETGLTHLRTSIKTLKSLEKTNPDNTELQQALADTEYSLAYATMYHQGDLKAGNPILKSALTRYERLNNKIDDPQLKLDYARARLINLFYASPDGFADNREAVEDVRRDYEALITQYPEYKRTIPQYVSFLRNVAEGPFQSFSGGPTTLVPHDQRDIYEQALRDVNRSLELVEGLLADEPTNTEHIYQFIWSAEILILMELVDKEWEIGYEEMIETLARQGAPYTSESLKQSISNFEPVAKDTAKIKRLFALLERGDKMLAQIAPYEAETFTHVEASYYNIKMHSYIHGRFGFDFEKAHAFNDNAKSMIDSFKAGAPDFRNAYTEDAITHSEKAFIYIAQQALLGQDNQSRICDHIAQARDLWRYTENRWGKIEDYAADVVFTQTLEDQSDCN